MTEQKSHMFRTEIAYDKNFSPIVSIFYNVNINITGFIEKLMIYKHEFKRM